MSFKEIEKILNKYKFYGFTVSRDSTKTKFTYTYHSTPYYAVNIKVFVTKIDKEKLVTKAIIGDVEINDEKDLIPTLNNLYKIHNKILYGCKKY